MTVLSTSREVTYNCNGSLVDFSVSFGFFDTSDLIVTLIETSTGDESILTESTDYSVTTVNNDFRSGATVTTTATYSSDYQIKIERILPLTQEVKNEKYDPFDSAAQEAALDKLTMIVQQQEAEIGNWGSGTLAELNTAITDATLDDVSGARTPTAHATSHQSAGSDAIKLDDLANPDDNTDLNASTLAHGLMHKLSGSSTEYFAGDGTWQTPAGTGDVVGPASSTNLAICIFDGTTGKLIKSTPVTIDATTNNMSIPGNILLTALTTEIRKIELGMGRTDNGVSFIDLIGDATYTDYGVRLIRNGGANGGSTLTSRGLGALLIKNEEAADIVFAINAITRMAIAATGEVGIGTTAPAYKLDVEGGIRETDAPDVSWTTATKTLALTEAGTEIIADSASAQTLTIPADASVAFNVGVKLVVYMVGAGAVTIAGDTGVTVNGVSAGSGTMTQYTAVELKKIAADTWIVIGNVTIT